LSCCTPSRATTSRTDDPDIDLDMASAGVVKVLDGQSGARDPRDRRCQDFPWEPKAAVDALADWFGREGGLTLRAAEHARDHCSDGD
jgi:hypothetical protein